MVAVYGIRLTRYVEACIVPRRGRAGGGLPAVVMTRSGTSPGWRSGMTLWGREGRGRIRRIPLTHTTLEGEGGHSCPRRWVGRRACGVDQGYRTRQPGACKENKS